MDISDRGENLSRNTLNGSMHTERRPLTRGAGRLGSSERSAPADSRADRDIVTVEGAMALLWRRKVLVLLSILVCAGLALGLSITQQPWFAARSEVLLSTQNLPSLVTGVAAPWRDPARLAATQSRVARAPEIATAVAARAGEGLTASEFLQVSRVAVTADADLLHFVVEDSDAARAQRLATIYAEEYVAYRTRLENRSIAAARQSLEDERDRLQRIGQGDSSLATSISGKIQDLRTLQTVQAADAYPVGSASEAEKVRPKPVRAGVLGVLAGAFVGVLLAMFRDRLDTTVRGPDELSARLGLPIAARVPRLPGRGGGRERVLMHESPNPLLAEAYRMLRANVRFSMADSGSKVLLITSAAPGEGKSTTATNLAVGLAMTGRNVALLDLDLRRPTLHNAFHVPRFPGVADIVLDRIHFEEASSTVFLSDESSIGPDESAGSVRLVPAGAALSNPGELVTSPAIAQLIDDLRASHDYVVVDSGPSLLVSDTRVLTGRVDCLLVVSRPAGFEGATVSRLREFLDQSPAPAIGLVCVTSERPAGYGYGYGASVPEPAGHRRV